MRIIKIYTLFIVMCLLMLCSCSNSDGKEQPTDAVVLAASFQQENGNTLEGGSVCLSIGESSTAHQLNNDGELKASGLTRNGDLTLTLYDKQEQLQGSMSLSVSTGAVIDAAMDESGVGHITLKGDTDEISLVFVLNNDGTIFCSLSLQQAGTPDFDLSKEGQQ